MPFSFIKKKNSPYHTNVVRVAPESSDVKPEIRKVMNLLDYTKKSGTSYSAGKFDAGYHSFELDGVQFQGQRNPKMRFENLEYDFTGKSVLDLGSNQGGMLDAIADKISYGVGVDYDTRMVNAANRIKVLQKNDHINFYVFDLANENLDYLEDFLITPKVDVVFLLSICMWIPNWKEVIKFSRKIGKEMVFESNGKPEQQDEQVDFLKSVYDDVILVNETSDDDPSQKNRRLYHCK